MASIAKNDTLAQFEAGFDVPSSRQFQACPEILRKRCATINENYSSVMVANREEGFWLVHYTDTVEDGYKKGAKTAVEEAKTSGKPVKAPSGLLPILKGAIFSNEGKLVCRGYGFTPKVVADNETFAEWLGHNQKRAIREYREGIVVRVWRGEKTASGLGKVYVSTTRRIDARMSHKDSTPTVQEMLEAGGMDEKKLQAITVEGVVHVLLIVHPTNQLVNEEVVKPTVYYLTSWVPRTMKPNVRTVPDPLTTMIPAHIDVGLPEIPFVTPQKAWELYQAGKPIFVSDEFYRGVVWIPTALGARLAIRGERDHLYHRYVELGDKRHLLATAVAAHFKEEVAKFPARFEADMKGLIEYLIAVHVGRLPAPPGKSSLKALHDSVPSIEGETEETAIARLKARIGKLDKPTVLYNMFATLRTRVKVKSPPSGGMLSPPPAAFDPSQKTSGDVLSPPPTTAPPSDTSSDEEADKPISSSSSSDVAPVPAASPSPKQ